MKRFYTFVVCCCLGFLVQAQEFTSGNVPNFEVQNSKADADADFSNPDYFPDYQFGAFQQSKTFTIPEAIFSQPVANQKDKINMMAISAQTEYAEKKGTYSMRLPSNAYRSPKSSIQIYGNQGFSRRTGDNLNFNGKTPDGGIRNEVYEDMQQPFINPYYGMYNRGYSRRYGPRSRFYFTR